MFRLYEVDPDADVLLILPAASAAAAPNGRESGASNPPPPELRIKVSSKHLGLASRHFRDRLKWGEWSTSEPDGRFHVRLEGFDAGAVAIVMDVLHGRGGRVPRSVDLETLAKVAVFVDEFQCFDAVEVYAERWIGKLEGSLPGAFGRDAVLWMFVAYVFRRSDLFKEVTRLAILHSTGPISDLGLPVREKIIRIIDSRRRELIARALAILRRVLDNLSEGQVSCPYECDSFLLGALTKALHRNGLASLPPSSSFPGVSFVSVVEALCDVRKTEQSINAIRASASARTRKRKSPWPGDVRPAPQPTPEASPEPELFGVESLETHVCAAKDLFTPGLDGLEAGVEGLELESSLGYYLY